MLLNGKKIIKNVYVLTHTKYTTHKNCVLLLSMFPLHLHAFLIKSKVLMTEMESWKIENHPCVIKFVDRIHENRMTMMLLRENLKKKCFSVLLY